MINRRSPSFEESLEQYSRSIRTGPSRREVGVTLSSVAALAVCTTESEAVTLITPVGELITSGAPNNVLLDFEGTGIGVDFEFTADNDPAYPFVRAGGRGGIEIAGRSTVGYFYASRLASNADIGAGNLFVGGSTVNKLLAFSYPASALTGGDWFGAETGFIGIRIPNEADFNYGWIEVEINPDNVSGTVIRYGIEQDVNVPAQAGVGVPETNSLACLALGAAGLLGWRQRRQSV